MTCFNVQDPPAPLPPAPAPAPLRPAAGRAGQEGPGGLPGARPARLQVKGKNYVGNLGMSCEFFFLKNRILEDLARLRTRPGSRPPRICIMRLHGRRYEPKQSITQIFYEIIRFFCRTDVAFGRADGSDPKMPCLLDLLDIDQVKYFHEYPRFPTGIFNFYYLKNSPTRSTSSWRNPGWRRASSSPRYGENTSNSLFIYLRKYGLFAGCSLAANAGLGTTP